MPAADCPRCGDEFTSPTGVRDHAWDAHGVCHHCGEPFDDQSALYSHWLDAHDDELAAETRKRAENAVGGRTVCPGCGDRFGSEGAVRAHVWDAHDVCHRCGDGFDDVTGLETHRLGAHGEELSREERARAEAAVADLSAADRLRYRGPVGALGETTVSRRAVIGGGAVGLGGLLAGGYATGAFGGGDGGGATALADHAAAASVSDEPALGPPPGEATGTIVAFEDPSCPSCARFERDTFPRIERDLVEPGVATFVFRGIPVVYDWGEPATLALEATAVRDTAAFWQLKTFYYDRQSRFGTDNVLDATEQFLTGETAVDGAAVVDAVQEGEARPAVQTDLDAAEAAGVGGTPTFYLFRDGEFVTDVAGPQSYEVFANALGV
jgi:protein-disulfide isomerase/transcription elongation factor Elf1